MVRAQESELGSKINPGVQNRAGNNGALLTLVFCCRGCNLLCTCAPPPTTTATMQRPLLLLPADCHGKAPAAARARQHQVVRPSIAAASPPCCTRPAAAGRHQGPGREAVLLCCSSSGGGAISVDERSDGGRDAGTSGRTGPSADPAPQASQDELRDCLCVVPLLP